MPIITINSLPENTYILRCIKKFLNFSKSVFVEVIFSKVFINTKVDVERYDRMIFGEYGLLGGWKMNDPSNVIMRSVKHKVNDNKIHLHQATAVIELKRGHTPVLYIHPLYSNTIQDPEKIIDILDCFDGSDTYERQERLSSLQATERELRALIDRGFLRPQKNGTYPRRLMKPIPYAGVIGHYKYYDLAGLRLTPQGRNVLDSCPRRVNSEQLRNDMIARWE